MANTFATIAQMRKYIGMLKTWAYQYYVLNQPVVDDSVYDETVKFLKELEKLHPSLVQPDSPTSEIQDRPTGKLVPIRHTVRMLSLFTNTDYRDEGCIDFVEKMKSKLGYFPETIIEWKYDGLACELLWQDGTLVQAATRGDTLMGESILQNVLDIKHLPKQLAGVKLLRLRGEIVLDQVSLCVINMRLKERGDKPYVNMRNAAAGIARSQATSEFAHHLNFRPYQMIEIVLNGLVTVEKTLLSLAKAGEQDIVLGCLGALGFLPGNYETVSNFEELLECRKKFREERGDMIVPTDGLVYKVNSLALQERLGCNNTEPIWAQAHKFEPEKSVTLLKDIVVQIGRSGKATPVAIIDPVFVGGVTVTNATLHNIDQVNRLRARIGATVVVQRAGDVIPEVVQVLDPTDEVWAMPSICPSCSTPLFRDGAEWRCRNKVGCSAQSIRLLEYAVGKKCLDIDGLGEALLGQLHDAGEIKDLSDLFCIGYRKQMDLFAEELKTPPASILTLPLIQAIAMKTLSRMDKVGLTKATKILKQIELAKDKPLPAWICALGIPLVAQSTADELAKRFTSLQEFLDRILNDPGCIEGIANVGPETQNNIRAYFAVQENVAMIQRLLALGIKGEYSYDESTRPLLGTTFVITGDFPIDREDIEEFLKKRGAKVSGSVSSKTTALIVGRRPGKTKIEAAEKYATPLINTDAVERFAKEPNIWREIIATSKFVYTA